MNTDLLKRLADRLDHNVITGHDWPNTDDELLRLQCAKLMREAATALEEVASVLPGSYYMDPPDGGMVTVLEQLQRMAKDAELGRRQREHTEAADACIRRIEA
jgi:hypothetical protein